MSLTDYLRIQVTRLLGKLLSHLSEEGIEVSLFWEFILRILIDSLAILVIDGFERHNTHLFAE